MEIDGDMTWPQKTQLTSSSSAKQLQQHQWDKNKIPDLINDSLELLPLHMDVVRVYTQLCRPISGNAALSLNRWQRSLTEVLIRPSLRLRGRRAEERGLCCTSSLDCTSPTRRLERTGCIGTQWKNQTGCLSLFKADFNKVSKSDRRKCSVRNVEACGCQVVSPHLMSVCAFKVKNKTCCAKISIFTEPHVPHPALLPDVALFMWGVAAGKQSL